MEKLLTIEVEEAAVERISDSDNVGILIILKCGTHILVSSDKIGIFSESAINSPGRDFSKIETISLGALPKRAIRNGGFSKCQRFNSINFSAPAVEILPRFSNK